METERYAYALVSEDHASLPPMIWRRFLLKFHAEATSFQISIQNQIKSNQRGGPDPEASAIQSDLARNAGGGSGSDQGQKASSRERQAKQHRGCTLRDRGASIRTKSECEAGVRSNRLFSIERGSLIFTAHALESFDCFGSNARE
jgi:hypothetical protein